MQCRDPEIHRGFKFQWAQVAVCGIRQAPGGRSQLLWSVRFTHSREPGSRYHSNLSGIPCLPACFLCNSELGLQFPLMASTSCVSIALSLKKMMSLQVLPSSDLKILWPDSSFILLIGCSLVKCSATVGNYTKDRVVQYIGHAHTINPSVSSRFSWCLVRNMLDLEALLLWSP